MFNNQHQHGVPAGLPPQLFHQPIDNMYQNDLFPPSNDFSFPLNPGTIPIANPLNNSHHNQMVNPIPVGMGNVNMAGQNQMTNLPYLSPFDPSLQMQGAIHLGLGYNSLPPQ